MLYYVSDFSVRLNKFKFTQPDNCCLRQTFNFFFPLNYNAPPPCLTTTPLKITKNKLLKLFVKKKPIFKKILAGFLMRMVFLGKQISSTK